MLESQAKLKISEPYHFQFQISDSEQDQYLVINLQITEKQHFSITPVIVLGINQSTPTAQQFKTLFMENSNTNQYYYDKESIATRHYFHQIQLAPPLQLGTYSISIFDMEPQKSSGSFISSYQVEINEDIICKNDCIGNPAELSQGLCMRGKCVCNEEYGGENCGFHIAKAPSNQEQSFYVSQKKWQYFSFDLDSNRNTEYIIRSSFQAQNPNFLLSINYVGFSVIDIPNSYFNFTVVGEQQFQEIKLSKEKTQMYLHYISVNNVDIKPEVILGYFNNGNEGETFHAELEIVYPVKDVDSLQLFVLIPLLIIMGCLVCLSVLRIISWCRRIDSLNPSRAQSVNQEAKENENGLSKTVYEKYMPISKYKEVTDEYPDIKEIKDCAICMVDFVEEDEVRTTTCYHVFHSKCIDEWWQNKNFCPQCRQVLTEDEIQKIISGKTRKNPYVQKIMSNRTSMILDKTTDQNISVSFNKSCQLLVGLSKRNNNNNNNNTSNNNKHNKTFDETIIINANTSSKAQGGEFLNTSFQFDQQNKLNTSVNLLQGITTQEADDNQNSLMPPANNDNKSSNNNIQITGSNGTSQILSDNNSSQNNQQSQQIQGQRYFIDGKPAGKGASKSSYNLDMSKSQTLYDQIGNNQDNSNSLSTFNVFGNMNDNKDSNQPHKQRKVSKKLSGQMLTEEEQKMELKRNKNLHRLSQQLQQDQIAKLTKKGSVHLHQIDESPSRRRKKSFTIKLKSCNIDEEKTSPMIINPWGDESEDDFSSQQSSVRQQQDQQNNQNKNTNDKIDSSLPNRPSTTLFQSSKGDEIISPIAFKKYSLDQANIKIDNSPLQLFNNNNENSELQISQLMLDDNTQIASRNNIHSSNLFIQEEHDEEDNEEDHQKHNEARRSRRSPNKRLSQKLDQYINDIENNNNNDNNKDVKTIDTQLTQVLSKCFSKESGVSDYNIKVSDQKGNLVEQIQYSKDDDQEICYNYSDDDDQNNNQENENRSDDSGISPYMKRRKDKNIPKQMTKLDKQKKMQKQSTFYGNQQDDDIEKQDNQIQTIGDDQQQDNDDDDNFELGQSIEYPDQPNFD